MTFSYKLKERVVQLRRLGYSTGEIIERLEQDTVFTELPTKATIWTWCRRLDATSSAPPAAAHDSTELLTILEGLRSRTIDAALALKIRSVDEATRAITRLQRLISELDTERKAGISDEELAIVLATVLKVIAADNEVAPLLRGKEVQWLGEIKTVMAQVE